VNAVAEAMHVVGRDGDVAPGEPPRSPGLRVAVAVADHHHQVLDAAYETIRAVNEADRGLLPAEATIALGQPMAVDPSRAPEGSWVLWVQLQELPSRAKRTESPLVEPVPVPGWLHGRRRPPDRGDGQLHRGGDDA
jgi:hypothetical protein